MNLPSPVILKTYIYIYIYAGPYRLIQSIPACDEKYNSKVHRTSSVRWLGVSDDIAKEPCTPACVSIGVKDIVIELLRLNTLG